MDWQHQDPLPSILHCSFSTYKTTHLLKTTCYHTGFEGRHFVQHTQLKLMDTHCLGQKNYH